MALEYLVGGAVRNRLLGLPVTERDWVVVGSTPEEMLRRGFTAVGRDFPVFLHPKTREEYALARTERKTGKGHTAFECTTDAVTLEEDLKRRDLTINAIAEDPDHGLIDPWGGLTDIDNRLLRHVSEAFAEDPLRVLRVARFAALLHPLSFTIHPETLALMAAMAAGNELDELPPERIRLELEKALATDAPATFFEVLGAVGASTCLWPEVRDVHIRFLEGFSTQSSESDDRFIGLVHAMDVTAIESLCRRLRISRKTTDAARLVSRHYGTWLTRAQLAAEPAIDFLYDIDAFRQADRFDRINHILQLIATTNGFAAAPDIAARWSADHTQASQVTAATVGKGVSGPALGTAIRKQRVQALLD